MRRGRVESALFLGVEVFELVALRARRRCGLSDATGIRGIGGRGAENEISKVAPHHRPSPPSTMKPPGPSLPGHITHAYLIATPLRKRTPPINTMILTMKELHNLRLVPEQKDRPLNYYDIHYDRAS